MGRIGSCDFFPLPGQGAAVNALRQRDFDEDRKKIGIYSSARHHGPKRRKEEEVKYSGRGEELGKRSLPLVLSSEFDKGSVRLGATHGNGFQALETGKQTIFSRRFPADRRREKRRNTPDFKRSVMAAFCQSTDSFPGIPVRGDVRCSTWREFCFYDAQPQTGDVEGVPRLESTTTRRRSLVADKSSSMKIRTRHHPSGKTHFEFVSAVVDRPMGRRRAAGL